jgi:hypothetical protein
MSKGVAGVEDNVRAGVIEEGIGLSWYEGEHRVWRLCLSGVNNLVCAVCAQPILLPLFLGLVHELLHERSSRRVKKSKELVFNLCGTGRETRTFHRIFES